MPKVHDPEYFTKDIIEDIRRNLELDMAMECYLKGHDECNCPNFMNMSDDEILEWIGEGGTVVSNEDMIERVDKALKNIDKLQKVKFKKDKA